MQKVVESANEGALSPEEIEANQLQIDSAIASVTRIANTSTFGGRRLLDGSLDYITSGVDYTDIGAIQVNGVQFGTLSTFGVNVNVLVSAQPALLSFVGTTVTSSITIELAGPIGTTTLQFGSGTSVSQITSAVNAVRETTGISAINLTSGFRLNTREYGSRQFIGVRVLPGSGTSPFSNVRGVGRDAQATINGSLSRGDGNKLSLKTSTLDLGLTLRPTFGVGTTSFVITSGGAMFQVGPQVNTNQQINLGLPSVTPSNLGNVTMGFLSQIVTGGTYAVNSGHAHEASRIVTEAVRQIAMLRGRMGAFERNVVDTNINQLSLTSENLIASESSIRDADFAMETSRLSKDQVLVAAGTRVLGIANQTPQQVLQLLGG
jgi:flagellin